MARLSGLQRDVLSLYRQCLREVRKKPIVRGLLPFQIPDYRSQPIEPQILLNLYFDLFPLISITRFCSVFYRTLNPISKTTPGMSSTLHASFPPAES